jgi:hypothetical protein
VDKKVQRIARRTDRRKTETAAHRVWKEREGEKGGGGPEHVSGTLAGPFPPHEGPFHRWGDTEAHVRRATAAYATLGARTTCLLKRRFTRGRALCVADRFETC